MTREQYYRALIHMFGDCTNEEQDAARAEALKHLTPLEVGDVEREAWEACTGHDAHDIGP